MKTSAGLLVYRLKDGVLEVFLIHPGGPFWARKDAGAWSIPKGELDDQEDPLQAARREFQEETGFETNGPFLQLNSIVQSPHKKVVAWTTEGDYDPSEMKSNTFECEWPPKSGKIKHFPEADRAAWFPISEARKKILQSQLPLLDHLERILTQRHKDARK